MKEIKNQIEALLFASAKAMTEEDLANLIQIDKKTIRTALMELKSEYENRNTSLMLLDSDDVWKINVKEKYMNLVTKIVSEMELSLPVMETLAIVAWKAPLLQSDVVKTRGSGAYDHIKELVDLGFVSKEKKGRSFNLRLAKRFFEYFDVPGQRSLKEVFEELKKDEMPKKIADIPVIAGAADKNKPSDVDIKEKLGGLDVVEAKDSSEKPAEDEKSDEEPEVDDANKEKTIEEVKDDPKGKEFLAKIEEQISKISSKNDNRDQDPDFQRRESEEGDEETDGEETDQKEVTDAEPDEESEQTEENPVNEEQIDPESSKEDESEEPNQNEVETDEAIEENVAEEEPETEADEESSEEDEGKKKPLSEEEIEPESSEKELPEKEE